VHYQAWPVFVLVLVLFLWMGHKLYHSDYTAEPMTPAAVTAPVAPASGASAKTAPPAKAPTNPQNVARVLYGDFLYPFEAASVLLLVAVVGAVFLAKKEV
jgi:NADH:ubiquinone oxidoreductase subunit 6 (subunit J)